MYGSQTARDKLGSQKGKSPDLQLRSQSETEVTLQMAGSGSTEMGMA